VKRLVHRPPARVLLCLEDCFGEFYLPLDLDDPCATELLKKGWTVA